MTDRSKIEWCDATINPVPGCSPVSEGCANCYAARAAATRLKHHPTYKGLATYKDGRGLWTGEIRLNPTELEKPLHWRKPRRIFVCSMSDLFHEDVTFEFVANVFQCIADCPQHIFLILTKRPERMKQFFDEWWNPGITDKYLRGGTERERSRLYLRKPGCSECRSFFLGCLNGRKKWADRAITPNYRKTEHLDYFGCPDSICDAFQWSAGSRSHGVAVAMDNGEISVKEESLDGSFPAPLKNLWLGFTAENQARFDERWAYAKQIPAAVVWVSHEPALGPIDYPTDFLARGCRAWVVTGGESGPHARPMHPDIPRHDRDQCQAARVPFFFKQWGEWAPTGSGRWAPVKGEKGGNNNLPGYRHSMYRVGKKAAGRKLDGRTWEEYPV